MLSQLEYSGRIDSEYYRPECLKLENLLRGRNSTKLGKIADFLIGPFGSAFTVENYTDDRTYRYIRGKDVKPMRLLDNDNVYMPASDFNRLEKYALKKRDIIISVVGTIGNAAIIKQDDLPAIFSCKCTVARVRGIDPHYLLTYLNTKFGQLLLKRKERGAVQMGLNLNDLKTLDIYEANSEFQEVVASVYKKTVSIEKWSKKIFSEAEFLLLDVLDLKNYSPEWQLVNIKLFKDSFVSTGRLDAEYYQSKYNFIEDAFNRYFRIRLADLVNYPISSGVTPKAGGDDYTDAEDGIPFVRAVDLQNGQVSVNNFNYLKPEIHNGMLKRTQLKQNDFLFSIAGTVGRCAVFEHAFEANINQAVAILRFNDERVNHYYLMVLLNSSIGKEFVAKYARQGLQTNLNLSEVGDLSIPIIPKETQTKIATLVKQSFTLKAESERLLEAAKRAVEIAIEQDEAAGMAYLAQSAPEAA